jgi:hypothetical protein
VRQFNSIRELDHFILNGPDQEVEDYLMQVMGKEKFLKYKKELEEYENSLIHGTGTTPPIGILNYNP